MFMPANPRNSDAQLAIVLGNIFEELHEKGYCGLDIIGSLFKLTKAEDFPEELKLEFIKEIGFAHMRVLDGLDTMLQIAGLAAKLCCQAQAKGAGKA